MNLFAASSLPTYKRHKPRCEFKYQIHASQVPAIKAAIEPYCTVDPFVGSAGRYTITSLYLDTPRRDLYWATENQRHSRMKLRIRTYGMHCEGPVFLEIKRRFGDAQSKSRVQVPRDEWRLAVEPGGLEKARAWNMDAKKWAIVEDFSAQVAGWGLEPAVCVRYDRDPYVGVLNPDIRITFDQAIRAKRSYAYELHPDDRDYQPVDFAHAFEAPEPRLVLEVKFDMRYPIWLIDLVRDFNLKREAFAKYCRSLERVDADLLPHRTDDRAARWEP